MKLSKRTVDILKNYATINPSIYIPEGSLLQTMSVSENIISYAEADEKFPTDLAIYDLFELLKVIELFNDPDLTIGETSVTIRDDTSSCVYTYGEKDIIASPKAKIDFPSEKRSASVSFKLSKDQLDKLFKAVNTLNLPMLCITKDNKKIIIKTVDPKNPSANEYSLIVGEDDSKADYEFYINHENLKLVRDDYQVDLAKGISKFTTTDGIEYMVAVEKISYYTE